MTGKVTEAEALDEDAVVAEWEVPKRVLRVKRPGSHCGGMYAVLQLGKSRLLNPVPSWGPYHGGGEVGG